MDRGAWKATVHGVAKNRARLSDFTSLQPIKLLCPWKSLSKNTGVGCHSLLQGIFLTQEQNLCLPPCRQILHCLSHQGLRSINLSQLLIWSQFKMLAFQKYYINGIIQCIVFWELDFFLHSIFPLRSIQDVACIHMYPCWWLHSIPCCRWTIEYLTTHTLKDIWVVSRL